MNIRSFSVYRCIHKFFHSMTQVEFTNRDNFSTGRDSGELRHNPAPCDQELKELLSLIESLPAKVSEIQNQHTSELQELMAESRRSLEHHLVSLSQVEHREPIQRSEDTDLLARKRRELHELNASVKNLSGDVERLKKRLKSKRESVPCLSSSVVASKRRLANLRHELVELVRGTDEPHSRFRMSGIDVGTMTDQRHPKAIQIEKGQKLTRALQLRIAHTERALVTQLLDTLDLSQETD